MDDINDKQLWLIARKRVAFKRSLIVYFVVNSFMCAIWFLTVGRNGGYFWPVWPILGWGLGLAFQYANAYTKNSFISAEKEYEKLKNGGN